MDEDVLFPEIPTYRLYRAFLLYQRAKRAYDPKRAYGPEDREAIVSLERANDGLATQLRLLGMLYFRMEENEEKLLKVFEEKRAWSSLGLAYLQIDIECFFVFLRSACDALAQMTPHLASHLKSAPPQSFSDQAKWFHKEKHAAQDPALAELFCGAEWFEQAKTTRDDLVYHFKKPSPAIFESASGEKYLTVSSFQKYP